MQCDRCQKWRRVPGSVDVEALPEQWYCEMNQWDARHNSCHAPEETEEAGEVEAANLAAAAAAAAAAANQARGGGGGGKPRRPEGGGGGGKQKVWNWVQCERRQCRKWRRLPMNVDPETLPDRWECSMNTWDPPHASCQAPEEQDEPPVPDGAGGFGRGGLLGGGAGGRAGKLSFRELIFNAEGKVRPPFSERSTMTSIFSVGHVSLAGREHDVEAYARARVLPQRAARRARRQGAREGREGPRPRRARARARAREGGQGRRQGRRERERGGGGRRAAEPAPPAPKRDAENGSGAITTADGALVALGGGPRDVPAPVVRAPPALRAAARADSRDRAVGARAQRCGAASSCERDLD